MTENLLTEFFFSLCQRLPFDWQNPMGFSIAIALQFIFIFNAAFAGICFAVFSIGMCLILIFATDDIKNGLKSLNQSVKNKQKRTKIWNQFTQIIQFHSKTKQLSLEN